MATREIRRSTSVGLNGEGDIENPHDLRELSELDDFSPYSSDHAPTPHPSTRSPRPTSRDRLFVDRQRSSSPPPPFLDNSFRPPRTPIPITRDPIFTHPHAPENHFASSPSDTEPDSDNAFRPILFRSPSRSFTRSNSRPTSHEIDHLSLVGVDHPNLTDEEAEDDQHDELEWHQIENLNVMEQDRWYNRRIQKREGDFQAVVAQSRQVQEQWKDLSKKERKKKAAEYKKKRNATHERLKRAERSYAKFLDRNDRHNTAPMPSSSSATPPTLQDGRFFPRDRQSLPDSSPHTRPIVSRSQFPKPESESLSNDEEAEEVGPSNEQELDKMERHQIKNLPLEAQDLWHTRRVAAFKRQHIANKEQYGTTIGKMSKKEKKTYESERGRLAACIRRAKAEHKRFLEQSGYKEGGSSSRSGLK